MFQPHQMKTVGVIQSNKVKTEKSLKSVVITLSKFGVLLPRNNMRCATSWLFQHKLMKTAQGVIWKRSVQEGQLDGQMDSHYRVYHNTPLGIKIKMLSAAVVMSTLRHYEFVLFYSRFMLLTTIFQVCPYGVWMWQGAQCSLSVCCLTEISCPRHMTWYSTIHWGDQS